MLAQQRKAAILDRVRAAGGVRVSELAADYGVSDMTIRRDLESLADRGLLAKVHGGATTVSPGSAYWRWPRSARCIWTCCSWTCTG
jgi:DeoR/GlpR family transcriptional regulator of sugar metabolism